MKKILYGGEIIAENQVLMKKALVFDHKILQIIDEEKISSIDGKTVFFEGYLSPGWIDLHIHGCSGSDTMDATPQALRTIAHNVAKYGTTSFLATTMTMEQERIEKALCCVREFKEAQSSGEEGGAQILGVHLEGPFINPEFKGAQEKTHIQKPNLRWIKSYLDIISMITLAPEMDDEFSFIKEMKDKVLLSVGHSGATYECACHAYEAGMRHITHCFNAMSPLHHRNPGVVGAAMLKPYSVDMITDFIHFHPDLLQGVITLKGTDKCVLITDAMRAAMMPDGTYDLGGQEVTLKDAACRLSDGTIAGSVHRLDKALKNTMDVTSCSLWETIHMMSLNPARLLKIDHRKGSIEAGKDADLAVLDRDFQVQRVYIGGKENACSRL